jgi:hypothetical protein
MAEQDGALRIRLGAAGEDLGGERPFDEVEVGVAAAALVADDALEGAEVGHARRAERRRQVRGPELGHGQEVGAVADGDHHHLGIRRRHGPEAGDGGGRGEAHVAVGDEQDRELETLREGGAEGARAREADLEGPLAGRVRQLELLDLGDARAHGVSAFILWVGDGRVLDR